MNHKPTRPTVGPRGGRAVQPTPCSECVSWRSCRPAAISEPFGCESWADQDGRRALPDELEPQLMTDREEAAVMAELGEDGPAVELTAEEAVDLLEPEPATPCEACQGIPSECRPCGCPEVEREPEGGGFTFESLGGLVKGRILSNPDDDPAPFRPAEAYRPDQSRGEAPAQSCLEMPDAGPLFAGCLEAKS